MGSRKTKFTARSFAFDFLACSLIVLSHFSNYVIYLGYDRIYPDLAAATLVLVGLAFAVALILSIVPFFVRGLIWAMLVAVVIGDAVFQLGITGQKSQLITSFAVLFVALALVLFLREHTAKVLTAVFAAMLGTTLLTAYWPSSPSSEDDASIQGDKGLPLIVHLVLDEHMGLASMSNDVPGGRELRRDIEAFYHRYGFRLFENAYSRYFHTVPSLASSLNFEEGGEFHEHVTRKRNKWVMDHNAYFDAIAKLGYRIRVYQSNYIDFCSYLREQSCSTYRPDGFAAKTINGLGGFERTRLLLDMYYSSIAVVRLVRLAEEPISRFLKEQGLGTRGLGLWHGRVGPIAIIPTLESLKNDIKSARGGTFFFAHLLLPHYPYVYDAECNVTAPISTWQVRTLADGTNTPQSREKRYGQYIGQLRCAMRQVGGLLEAMREAGTLDHATIIIQSDHGSRITEYEPTLENARSLTKRVLLDGFSAFYAVKRPGLRPGVTDAMAPLVQLLGRAFDFLPAPDFKGPPRVFLRSVEGGYGPWPLPRFGDPGAEAVAGPRKPNYADP